MHLPVSHYKFFLKASASSHYCSRERQVLLKTKQYPQSLLLWGFFNILLLILLSKTEGIPFAVLLKSKGKNYIHLSLIFWTRKCVCLVGTLGPVCIHAVILTHVLVSFYKDQWKNLYPLASLLLHKACLFCNQSL